MGSLLSHALFCLLILFALRGGNHVDAVSISGVGEAWSLSLYNDLATAYLYVQDATALTYTTTTNMSTAFQALDLGRIGFVSTPAILSASVKSSTGGVYYAVPVMATSMTALYNGSVFANSSSANTLLLDVATLADIWSGDITVWSDPRIAELNPYIALPQNTNITLIYCNAMEGEGDVLYRFLAKASPKLASMLNANSSSLYTPSLNALPPVVDGRAMAACPLADKLVLMANTTGMGTALVMTMLPEMGETNLLSINMLVPSDNSSGSANVTVSPSSSTAITNAMALAGSADDITSLGNNASWPLSTLLFVIVESNIPSLANTCYMLNYVFDLASWIQINDGAAALIAADSYVSLDPLHRRYMLDYMASITCANYTVLTATYLLGAGPTLPVYPSLADTYPSSDFNLSILPRRRPMWPSAKCLAMRWTLPPRAQ